MRTLILVLILSHAFITFAQIKVPPRGIYKTFTAFKQNSPSVKFVGTLDSIQAAYGNAWDKKYLTTYLLSMSKTDSKEIGSVFGFSDGTNFYIGSEPHNIYDFPFFKLNLLGDQYHYFERVTSGPYGATRACLILMMERGTITVLTANRLKSILKDNKELYDRFKAQKDKYNYFQQYLTEYQN